METRNLDVEAWSPVIGYEGRYEVSTLGRLRTYLRRGHSGVKSKPAIMKLRNLHPYQSTMLTSQDGKRKSFRVHQIVLRSFVGIEPNGWEASHLNGKPWDNRLINLRWESRSANFTHKKEHGTELCGEKHHQAKLKSADVRRIKRLLTSGKTQGALSKQFGVSQSQISRIKLNQRWSHL